MAKDFIAVIEIRGVNPFILVSAPRANDIKPGWRKPLPVLVRINGKPAKAWRINMMPVGNGSFYLYLHGDIRKASRNEVGDRVSVEDLQSRNGVMVNGQRIAARTAVQAGDKIVIGSQELTLLEGRESVGREISSLQDFVRKLPPGVEVLVGYMQYGHVVAEQPFTSDRAQAAAFVDGDAFLEDVAAGPFEERREAAAAQLALGLGRRGNGG